ncbi:hypothetical protein [Asanoa iriomotensis]|uniref:Uncharacterized protein n=1 Tax=Asanoa iriomotensis TaxID=234613 RepID=A0ABQ4BZU4_9ACTN|nr:hypothetical protein [Asanoa iriomotensis]GIF56039.1 hypothetical protein Air01nite_21340 [Asanoa iriomotensis]
MAEEERERQGGVTEPVTPVDAGSGEAPREPKWSGAAPVPPPAPKRRRWLEDESMFPPPPPPPASPPRDPTLDLPTGRAFEPDTPVDPWADADPLPAYPMDVTYPPTRLEQIGPPPPPPTPPPPAPLPVKKSKAKRPEPAGPPPGWRPPPGYVAVPVRRRRRWPWFALLSLLCCCGCPAWFGQPLYAQFPADAVVPATVGNLTLRDDQQSKRTAEQLKTDLRRTYVISSPFAGVFVDGDGKRATVFGTTGLHLSPDDDVTAEINRVTGTYQLRSITTVAATERGESRRCGIGTDNGTDVVVCSWVDYGSLGTGVFTRLDVDESNGRLSQLRDTIVTRRSDG